jgi:L-ribulokinase
MAGSRYVVGVDFGTLSGRAVVVRVEDGEPLGTATHAYPSGVIDQTLPATGAALPPDWALQEPADYVDVLRVAVPAAVRAAGVDPADVIGIGVDCTASTPMPVLRDGTPLCQVPDLVGRPHAYPKLWKHHAAQAQADRINEVAAKRGEDWHARYGGRISAEWQFAKALQVLEEDPEVYRRVERWIEATDWIVWQLCGVETRNPCTAGYKGIRQDGHYPSRGFQAALHPDFADFAETRLDHPLTPLGARAGGLTRRAAELTGLRAGIAVATGNVDAHVTAPAGRAVANGQMVAIMGTSTCHVMNAAVLAEVPGMCGVVDGGIIDGVYGYEAGQSGVGDIFGWWVDNGVGEDYARQAREAGESVHELLTRLAARQPVGAHGLLALDWLNGNRSVLVDHELSGVILGLTLATRPEDIYRALLESTAFGTRTIIEAFDTAGVPVNELVVAGGLVKNDLLMRIYADVTGKTLHVVDADQGPAVGSAIHAAVAAGAYQDVRAASDAMGRLRRDAFRPNPDNQRAYDALYREYVTLHDHFGRGGNDVLHRLRRIRNEAISR